MRRALEVVLIAVLMAAVPVAAAADDDGDSDVQIDIAPGNDLNVINVKANGIITVALLGSETFDATNVDVTRLEFGPDKAAPIDEPTVVDVNEDGFDDLVSLYLTQETGIEVGDDEACLKGKSLGSGDEDEEDDGGPGGGGGGSGGDGNSFKACDFIQAVARCGIGFELALLLPPLMWLRRRRVRA